MALRKDVRQDQIGGEIEGVENDDKCFQRREFFSALDHPNIVCGKTCALGQIALPQMLFQAKSADISTDRLKIHFDYLPLSVPPGYNSFEQQYICNKSIYDIDFCVNT